MLMILTTFYLDLREDRHYLADHPGLSPVTTAQVWSQYCRFHMIPFFIKLYVWINITMSQGEELRKLIGATYYIECSSKTQQVCSIYYTTLLIQIDRETESFTFCRTWKQFLILQSRKWSNRWLNKRRRLRKRRSKSQHMGVYRKCTDRP